MNDNFSMHCHTCGSLMYVGVALMCVGMALGGCPGVKGGFHMAASGVDGLAAVDTRDSANLSATVVLLS